MVRQEKKEIAFSFPLFTAVIAGVALLVLVIPSLSGLLIYDRGRIAEGQVWRILTGNLVHFSARHLFFNLAVFGVVGWATGVRGYPGFRFFCLLSAGFIGAALYVFSPDVAQYGGLSGVASGAVVYLALHGLSEKGVWRFLCAGALGLTACKIILEYRLDRFFFVSSADAAFVPVPLSHAVGSVTAVMVYWLMKGARWISIRNCCVGCGKNVRTIEPKEEGI